MRARTNQMSSYAYRANWNVVIIRLKYVATPVTPLKLADEMTRTMKKVTELALHTAAAISLRKNQ